MIKKYPYSSAWLERDPEEVGVASSNLASATEKYTKN